MYNREIKAANSIVFGPHLWDRKQLFKYHHVGTSVEVAITFLIYLLACENIQSIADGRIQNFEHATNSPNWAGSVVVLGSAFKKGNISQLVWTLGRDTTRFISVAFSFPPLEYDRRNEAAETIGKGARG